MPRNEHIQPGHPGRADGAPSVDVPETPLARLVQAAFADHPEWTLDTIARKSGLPLSTVSAYRSGQITGERASRDRLSRLAVAIGLPVEDVLEAAGASANADDEATLLKLFRRLPSGSDRAQAVEALRVHVRFARERKRGR